MLVSRCPRPALLLFGGLSVGRPQEGATRSHASLKWGLEGTSGFTSGFTLPLPPTVRVPEDAAILHQNSHVRCSDRDAVA